MTLVKTLILVSIHSIELIFIAYFTPVPYVKILVIGDKNTVHYYFFIWNTQT